ncbi:unnamed protein product [Lactuca virosa]|uniref:Uncharacterized protein n=1 Tax=Lactuca virosa TaxID=75947 RepID=A0AAU9LE91_9ASTR|nr:unnamed protein product [Lactuca virosa]
MEFLLPTSNGHYSWLNLAKEYVYILPHANISAFTTRDPETWFLPEELGIDHEAGDDDDMHVDTANADSPFEAEDHYYLLIRQLPPPFNDQPLGTHFKPQHEY